MVENTLSDLETSKCVAIEDDIHLSPLNLGSISTIERFSLSITSSTKMKGLLEVLSSASEYAYLPIRHGEEEAVRKLVNHQRFGSSCYGILHNGTVRNGEDITVYVTLERGYQNQLVAAIKRVSLQRKLKAKQEFAAVAAGGKISYILYFMCDSYMGCDQEKRRYKDENRNLIRLSSRYKLEAHDFFGINTHCPEICSKGLILYVAEIVILLYAATIFVGAILEAMPDLLLPFPLPGQRTVKLAREIIGNFGAYNEHPLGLSQQASVLPRRSGFSLAVGRNGSSPDNSVVVTNMLLEQLALKRDH
ncbi:hypothetical protein KIW84_057992 [Lathyrus oleraceus]|uniref:SEC63 domain-containing protein n=1 Tax=Pisum sativum TaxID=3888 RepID=A0A9D5APM7_PEA|nr:hypothetical protein KIW84_057992 [Pisum sativum]